MGRSRALPDPAAPLPEGFVYVPGFIGEAEESELLQAIERLSFEDVRMHGVVAKRKVIHYGWDYLYEAWKIEPAEPIPPFLMPLRDRCAAVVEIPPGQFEEALLAKYPVGAGIGWHRDAPMFGSTVIGISLGGECVMRFRRGPKQPESATAVRLEPRSMYLLSGKARSAWQHMIPPAKQLRYSITFRTVHESFKKQKTRE